MTEVTIKEFAEFIVKNMHVYYYRPNKTIHSYFRKSGQLCFWANWGGYETRSYQSLKALLDKESIPLPDRFELTPDVIRGTHGSIRRGDHA